MRNLDPDQGQNAEHDPDQAAQAVNHDLAPKSAAAVAPALPFEPSAALLNA